MAFSHSQIDWRQKFCSRAGVAIDADRRWCGCPVRCADLSDWRRHRYCLQYERRAQPDSRTDSQHQLHRGARRAYRRPAVLIVNSIPLAQSLQWGDAPSHGRDAQTDLVDSQPILPIPRFARCRDRDGRSERRLLASLAEDFRTGMPGDVLRHREGAVGSPAFGVQEPLRDHLPIEMRHLFDQPDILPQRPARGLAVKMLVSSATGDPVAFVNRFSVAMIGSSVVLSGVRRHRAYLFGRRLKNLQCFDFRSHGSGAYPRQADPRMTLQKLPRVKCGSFSASTSALTLPKVVSGLCLMPS